MGSFLKDSLKISWRFNRKKFWLYPIWMFLLVFIELFLLLTLINFILWNQNISVIMWLSISKISFIISNIWYLFILYIWILTYIKRLHDLNKSGWMSILLLIPFINIYIIIICGFLKWTVGKNQYWEDPLGQNKVNKWNLDDTENIIDEVNTEEIIEL